MLCRHNCAPYALAWGEHVVAAGENKRVVFFDESGRVVQNFDHGDEAGEREPSCAAISPSGQSCVIGSFDKLRVYNFNVRRQSWDELPPKVVGARGGGG